MQVTPGQRPGSDHRFPRRYRSRGQRCVSRSPKTYRPNGARRGSGRSASPTGSKPASASACPSRRIIKESRLPSLPNMPVVRSADMLRLNHPQPYPLPQGRGSFWMKTISVGTSPAPSMHHGLGAAPASAEAVACRMIWRGSPEISGDLAWRGAMEGHGLSGGQRRNGPPVSTVGPLCHHSPSWTTTTWPD